MSRSSAKPGGDVVAVAVTEVAVILGGYPTEGGVLDRGGDEIPFWWTNRAAFQVQKHGAAVLGDDDVADPGIAVDDLASPSLGQRGVAVLQVIQLPAKPGPILYGQGGGCVNALREPGERRHRTQELGDGQVVQPA